MACVFGEMRTLKTGSRWSPKSVLFGEKEKNARAATALRSAFRGRVGMKSLPRYARAPRSG